MKLRRCACGCSAAPLLRSRSAPFRAELRAVRTFAAGGACFGPFGALRHGRQPDRLGRWSAEPNSVRTAAKRENTFRNAAVRPGAGWEPVRRSAMRENSPSSFPKKNRFDKPGAEPNGSSGSAEAGKATVEKRAIATRCFAPKTAFADARRSEGDLSDGSAAQSEGCGAADAEGA